MAGRWDEEFQEFVAARGGVLHRAAYLLCGDWHEAEDLTQIALARVYRVWWRVRSETAEAYTRRVLVRCFLDSRRRAWRRHEQLSAEVPDVAGRSGDPEGRLVVCGGGQGAAAATSGTGAAVLDGPVGGRDRGDPGLLGRHRQAAGS